MDFGIGANPSLDLGSGCRVIVQVPLRTQGLGSKYGSKVKVSSIMFNFSFLSRVIRAYGQNMETVLGLKPNFSGFPVFRAHIGCKRLETGEMFSMCPYKA